MPKVISCYVLLLPPTNDKNLVTAIGPDIPGGNRTRNTDDNGTEERRPETGHLKVIQHRGDEAEHPGIQYENKQAKRHDGERQRHYEYERSNDRVDQSKEKGCEYEIAGAFYPDSGQQPGGQIQTQHGYQGAD
jgi:hypothetical protein